MWIDFSSRPPAHGFSGAAVHLQNYRRVYQSSEARSAQSEASQDLQGYLDAYERLGARHVVLKARDVETTFGFKISNETVAGFCREHGPRFIGFAGVDPHKGKQAVEEFERAVRDLGLKGLNLQCFELKLCPNDRLLYPLYEKAVELGVPVNIHCGINFSNSMPMRYGRPEYLDDVMVDFPSMRVCASPPGWPWVNELIGVAWRHPNLWIGVLAVRPRLLEKSHSGYEPLLQYGRTVLQDKMIFGTSFPMMPIEKALDEMQSLSMDDAIRSKWLHGNAASFLGLNSGV
jgi:uncharacterized protein